MNGAKFNIDLDSIKSRDKQYLTHGIHPYPAKYIPQIPGALLDYLNLPPKSIVLDPFCGSGTTLVEANIRELDAIGVDTNPIGCLVSKVKTTHLSSEEKNIIIAALKAIKLYEDALVSENDFPSFLNRDHWFEAKMLCELTYIKKQIDQIENPSANDFLSVAFSSIIVKCSRQESDTRWAAKQKNLPARYAITEFIKKAEYMLIRTTELEQYVLGKSNIHTADSQNLSFVENGCVNCVITSPPYMNSYDYYLYHKLRMYWLGYNHYVVQKAEIGSRNKHCDNAQGPEEYYKNILAVANQIKNKLVKDGYCCMVIGDSIIKNQLIKMDEIYRQIFSKAGFLCCETFSFNQRKYTKAFTPNIKTAEKQSHIMIFKK